LNGILQAVEMSIPLGIDGWPQEEEKEGARKDKI
jgi:hypothetical protein